MIPHHTHTHNSLLRYKHQGDGEICIALALEVNTSDEPTFQPLSSMSNFLGVQRLDKMEGWNVMGQLHHTVKDGLEWDPVGSVIW
jgi:hypothetical protein